MVRSAFARCVCFCSCLVVFFLSLSTAQAQCTGKILGHTDLAKLVCVDPGTGAVTSVGPGVATTAQFITLSALDTAGHRYFFVDDSFHLYVLDTQTGSQIGSALPLSMQLVGMKFDSSSGTLFGHAYPGTYPIGPVSLVTIDPAKGSVTTLGTVPNSGSLTAQVWIAALDSAGQRYFFLDSSNLYEINTVTGGQIAALPLSMPVKAIAMEFDSSSGKLFCHTYLGGVVTLVSIDPASGKVASVGAWPSSCSQDAVAALDSAGHTYFFLDCSSSSSVLQQMNTQTGVVGTARTTSVQPLILSGMEFAPGLNSAPPPGPAYVARVQQPLNPDGPSTFSTSRGSVPVKFTLTKNGAATCNLPAATISLLRTAGATTGTVAATPMPSDDGTNFRNSGCQYVYNLGISGLGAGTYEADITIGGSVVGKGTFTLEAYGRR